MRLVIYGSMEFSETVAELAEDCGHNVAGFIDDFSSGSHILGPLTEVQHSHPPGDYGIAMALGYKNLSARWDAWQRVRQAGYAAPALIHPNAYLAKSAKVAAGSMLMARSVVDVRASLGEVVVAWPGSCISHDCIVRENCFISPNATLCGYVELGAHSFVGAAAVIVDHCVVPARTRIKMNESYIGTRV